MICRLTTRTLLACLAAAFWVLAGFLWTVAGYVIVDYRNYDEFVTSRYTLVPAVTLIIVGIVFFFGGLLGCCALVRDNKCSLCMFGTLLIVLTTLLLTTGVAAYVYRGQIDHRMQNVSETAVRYKYTLNSTSLTKQIDWLQQNLHCCGANNLTDWMDSRWYEEVSEDYHVTGPIVPISCCKDAKECNVTDVYAAADVTLVYTDGCYFQFAHAFSSNLKLIGGVAIGLVVILCLGVISSCVLLRIYSNDDTPYYSLYS